MRCISPKNWQTSFGVYLSLNRIFCRSCIIQPPKWYARYHISLQQLATLASDQTAYLVQCCSHDSKDQTFSPAVVSRRLHQRLPPTRTAEIINQPTTVAANKDNEDQDFITCFQCHCSNHVKRTSSRDSNKYIDHWISVPGEDISVPCRLRMNTNVQTRSLNGTWYSRQLNVDAIIINNDRDLFSEMQFLYTWVMQRSY